VSTSTAALLLTLGAALLSMAAFAVAGGRRDRDAERKGSQFAAGAGDFLVHWFMWAIGPLERAALRLGATPDVFNMAGLAFGAASGVAIGMGQLEAGGWAIALGGACDILDGRIARARKLVSDYGTFIDSTLDRFVEAFAFLGFAYYLRETPHGAALAAAAISGSLLVSYARARGESVGVAGPKGLMQRAERLVLTCLACLADASVASWTGRPPGSLVQWVLWLIAVTTFVTAIHRTVAIARELRRRDAGRRS
jgi:CDP-diacylglycerol--glycerol-3-phosphate 3-phosphatidyltransferase